MSVPVPVQTLRFWPVLLFLVALSGCGRLDGLIDNESPSPDSRATTPTVVAQADGLDGSTPVAEVEITVDTESMTDFKCHAMGTTIMGNCSEEDIARLSAEIRTKMAPVAAETAEASEEDVGFVPGEGLKQEPPLARGMTSVRIEDGGRLTLRAEHARWAIGDAVVPGYAYNGQVPGPLLLVDQGDTVHVDFVNAIDQPTTVHWHGLRHDNADDGVPGVTQPVVMPGNKFAYTLRFPDPGLYWYHPHVREDIQQDAGLAGAILVTPSDPLYFASAEREEVLVLDDILIDAGRPVPAGRDSANFAIMGRFGNTPLVNGQPAYQLTVRPGEVVRFHVANVANVRPFRLTFDGARMKRVGGDLGRYEREEFVESVTVAPAERVIVDVLFEEPREHRMLHRSPGAVEVLGAIRVRGRAPRSAARRAFELPRRNPAETTDMDGLGDHLARAPDIRLVLDVRIPELLTADDASADEHAEEGAHGFDPAVPGSGIEWEDDMLAVNRLSDGDDVQWILRDEDSGAENGDVAYNFRVGDRVKIRLSNPLDSDHPMQHPIHFHGQRLLVLETNGRPNYNRVWKDTVLVPAGVTIAVLMDVTNPGAWMVHCHIAEHLENGMMFQFTVTGEAETDTSSPTPSRRFQDNEERAA